MPCYSHKQHSGIFLPLLLLLLLLTSHMSYGLAVNPFFLPFQRNFSRSFSFALLSRLHVLLSFQYIHQPTNHVICCESQSMVWNMYTYRLGKRFFSLCMYMYLFYSSHLLIFFLKGWGIRSFYFIRFVCLVHLMKNFIHCLGKKLFSPMDLHGKWKINFHFCCVRCTRVWAITCALLLTISWTLVSIVVRSCE